MLVEYIYDNFPNPVPVGCVVAVAKNKIGYSICSPRDTFNKKLGRHIATERANKVVDEVVYESDVPLRSIFNHESDCVDIDNALENAISHIADRANRYFKD